MAHTDPGLLILACPWSIAERALGTAFTQRWIILRLLVVIQHCYPSELLATPERSLVQSCACLGPVGSRPRLN